MKILFVINDPVFFLSHRLPIARAAYRQGMEVHVATPLEDCVEKIKEEGFSFHSIPLEKHGKSLLGELKLIFSLCSLFLSIKPDLLHLVTIKPILYGGIAAKLTRVPTVVSAVTGLGIIFVGAGWRHRIIRFFVRQIYRLSLSHKNQMVIFQNPDDQAYCVSKKIVSDHKTVVIKGSGVDMQLYAPSLKRSSSTRQKIVLFAGRMLWEKGVGDFVEAARMLRSRQVVARFVLVGLPVSWNKSSVKEEDLLAWHNEGAVEWWGQRDDMLEVFSQASIACLPSAYGEGVPKFLIEAAACGLPIVTTDSPGCREIVKDGANGFLVPVGNAEGLADALKELILNEGLRDAMGQAGRQLAKAEFSEELVVRQTLGVYESLLRMSKAK